MQNDFSMGFSGFLATMRNPTLLQESFSKLLQARGTAGKIDQDKTLAFFADYQNKQIGANSGSFHFFESSADYKYADSEHFLIAGLKFYDGNNANVDETDWNPGISIPGLKNSTISVVVSGVQMLVDFPLTQIYDSADNDSNPGWLWLPRPILLPGQNLATLELKIPNALAASDNIRIERVGMKLI